jgi:tripartite-type tricarboxylate transporter receptor subunit TctC
MGRVDPEAQAEGGVIRTVRCLLALFAAVVLIANPAGAQDYPNRSITLIVPFPPGGGNDTLARIIATKLSTALGQQVVVDNRGGANGTIAIRTAVRAAPDGYTLVFVNSSNTSITPALVGNVGYDVRKDFAPIGMFALGSIAVIAHPSFPPKTIPELIAFAKTAPGKLNIGTSAPGSGSHLAAELFKARTGINVTLVPYKGSAALTNDVLGGHIPVVFSVPQAALGAIQAGQLRAIAVTANERIPLMANVPTVAESIPGFEAVLRYGLLAPAGTPRPIIDRLNRELRTLVTADDVKARIASEAGNPLTSSPEQYAAEIAREDGIWVPLIRGLNIKVE